MAILGKIRKTGNRFVVIVVFFLLAMFLGTDLVRIIPHFARKKQIGSLFGAPISYADYANMDQRFSGNFMSQGKHLTQEDQIRLKDAAWRYLIEHMLYAKQIKQAGIAVGDRELVDLVQGEHIDAELIEAFKNPETGVFDKQKLLAYLNNLSSKQQAWWCEVEKQFSLKRAKHKLHQLMVQSCFVTALEEAEAERRRSLVCSVDYLHIPFSLVQDDLITLTDQPLQDYMAAHKSHYTALSESRTMQYITFPIQPDEKDNSEFQKEINTLIGQFSTTKDPYTFAKQQTDGPRSATCLSATIDTLPHAFSIIKHTLKEGMVIGPVVSDSFHTLYRLVKEEKGHYEIAVVQKKPIIGDHTRNAYFKEISDLAGQVKSLVDLEKLATNRNLTIQQETLAPSDYRIGLHPVARKVVCWLYNRATVGALSPIFDLGDAYLLGVMVDQVKRGDLLPLDSVRAEVYQKVLDQEKAKLILSSLKEVDALTLEGIAKAYGKDITVQSVDRLRFLENEPPHLKKAKAFVGKCFGLPLNVVSDPIIDEAGIFIAAVKNKGEESIPEKDNEQMRQIAQWMQPYYLLKVMEELAQVKDERYRVE